MKLDDQVAPQDSLLAWIALELVPHCRELVGLATSEQEMGKILTPISVYETKSYVTWKRSMSPVPCFKQTNRNSHPVWNRLHYQVCEANHVETEVQDIRASDFYDKSTACKSGGQEETDRKGLRV